MTKNGNFSGRARSDIHDHKPQQHTLPTTSRLQIGISYAKVVSGNSYKHPPPPTSRIPPVHLNKVPSMESSFQSSLTDDIKDIELLKDLPKLLNAEKAIFADVHYPGGLRIILKFHRKVEAEEYLINEHNWNRWFVWLKFGSVHDYAMTERLAHVKITGLPVFLRSIENTTAIAIRFGRVVETDGHQWSSIDISVCYLTVLTNVWKHINDEIECEAGGRLFKVGIIEHDSSNWEPFENRSFPESPPSIEDEQEASNNGSDEPLEDGVSDTWCINNDQFLEEGEIGDDEPVKVDQGSPVQATNAILDDSSSSQPMEVEKPPADGELNGHTIPACMNSSMHFNAQVNIKNIINNSEAISGRTLDTQTMPTTPTHQTSSGPFENQNHFSPTIPGSYTETSGAPLPEFGDSYIKRRRIDNGVPIPNPTPTILIDLNQSLSNAGSQDTSICSDTCSNT